MPWSVNVKSDRAEYNWRVCCVLMQTRYFCPAFMKKACMDWLNIVWSGRSWNPNCNWIIDGNMSCIDTVWTRTCVWHVRQKKNEWMNVPYSKVFILNDVHLLPVRCQWYLGVKPPIHTKILIAYSCCIEKYLTLQRIEVCTHTRHVQFSRNFDYSTRTTLLNKNLAQAEPRTTTLLLHCPNLRRRHSPPPAPKNLRGNEYYYANSSTISSASTIVSSCGKNLCKEDDSKTTPGPAVQNTRRRLPFYQVRMPSTAGCKRMSTKKSGSVWTRIKKEPNCESLPQRFPKLQTRGLCRWRSYAWKSTINRYSTMLKSAWLTQYFYRE